MKFEVYRNQRSQWRWVWRLLGGNNLVVARSAGQFNSAHDARRAIQRILFWVMDSGEGVDVVTKLAPQIEVGNVLRPDALATPTKEPRP